jgi:hypothetical protein
LANISTIFRPRHGPLRRRRSGVLLDMSTGQEIMQERFDRALLSSQRRIEQLNVKYVVINRERATAQLEEFARRGFGMTEVASDGPHVLLKTPDGDN